MCDMTAFIVRDGMEEKVLESVDLVEADGDAFELTNIFGDRKTLRARLKSLDNNEGKLLFEPL